MDDRNPFGAPTSNLFPSRSVPQAAAAPPRGVWRDGKTLVLSHGAHLPPRCVKCNQNVDQTDWLARKYLWHTPLLYGLLVINALIYIVVAMMLRQSATVRLGLCPECRSNRALKMCLGAGIIAMAFVLAGLLLWYGEGQARSDLTVLAIFGGFLSMLTGYFIYNAAATVLTPQRIDARFIRLRKVDPRFLDELPVWDARAADQRLA